MAPAVVQRLAGIVLSEFFGVLPVCVGAKSVHRLQKKMLKGQISHIFRANVFLWINQLQLMSLFLDKVSEGFGADADPVHCFRNGQATVGFDGYFKPCVVKGLDQRLVQL